VNRRIRNSTYGGVGARGGQPPRLPDRDQNDEQAEAAEFCDSDPGTHCLPSPGEARFSQSGILYLQALS